MRPSRSCCAARRRRRTDLRPVPAAAAGGLGAALWAYRHFPVGGSHRLRAVLRDEPGQRPVLTQELLEFYAKCYTTDPADPLCSPVLGDLTGFPPSLLFAGGDEILLDDARALQEKLVQKKAARARSASRRSAGTPMCCTVSTRIWRTTWRPSTASCRKTSPRPGVCGGCVWTTRPKYIPAAKRRNWTNFFRLSATLTGDGGYRRAAPRPGCHGAPLPSIAVRLRRGAFWYYLEEIPKAPPIQPEKSCPLAHAPFRGCGSAPSVCWCITGASPWSFSTPLPMARGR